MGDVVPVAQQELQGVLPRRQLDLGLRLPPTEMLMVGITRQRLIQRRQLVHIDQQIMVARVLSIRSGRRHAHARQPETNAAPGW